MGCIAEVKQLLRLPGGIRVLVEGLRRGEIIKYLNEDPFYLVKIKEYEEKEEKL